MASADPAADAATRITEAIALHQDWRGETLRRIRQLIVEAVPQVVEELKWVKPSNPTGVPTWSHEGILCTGEAYAAKVKVTFARGASLADRHGLFNASLDAGTRRAIDLHEGDQLDAAAFSALIREAVELNVAKAAGRGRRTR